MHTLLLWFKFIHDTNFFLLQHLWTISKTYGGGACEVQKRYLWKKLHAHHVTLTYIDALALKKIHIKEVLMRKIHVA